MTNYCVLDKLFNDKTAGWWSIPTRHDIENMKVGDLVPNPFGYLSAVTDIYARGININGKAYVCFYQYWDYGKSTISNSLEEGKPQATVPMTNKYSRVENYPTN